MGRGSASAGRGSGASGRSSGSGGGGLPDATASPAASKTAIARIERDLRRAENRAQFNFSPAQNAADRASVTRLRAERERLITGGRPFNERERANDIIRKRISYTEGNISYFEKRIRSARTVETRRKYQEELREARQTLDELRRKFR